MSIGKTRISLPGFTRTSIADIYVEDVSGDAGAETKREPPGRFLDQEDKFILGSVISLWPTSMEHSSEAMRFSPAAQPFMAHLQTSPSLEDATSEKGRFAADQTEFGGSHGGRVGNDTHKDEQAFI